MSAQLRVPRPHAGGARWGLLLALTACSEQVGDAAPAGTGGAAATSGSGAGGDVNLKSEGQPLEVEVAPEGTTFVALHPPSVIGTDEGLWAGSAWDLAFTGYEVRTNGGVSGPGAGGAFGPLAAPQFLVDEAPEVPFLIEDRFGGAFLDWYDYDGESHALYSRFHVYGVKRGDARYKVQILAYYGEIAGAPVAAIYSLRYAPVGTEGAGATVVVEGLDGTAGGVSGPPDAPVECLLLQTGARSMLAPEAAQASGDWDLCFRRDAISVNGGEAGPAGVNAVDLMRDEIATETLDAIKGKTPASEAARFEAVDLAALESPDLAWISDGIVTAFTGQWVAAGSDPPVPALATWWVVSPDATTGAMVAFIELAGASAATPGTVHLRVKAAP